MLIEDVACPVDKLADMTMDLVRMFEKYGYNDASCFGHALEGNLHLVFSQVPAQHSLQSSVSGAVRWYVGRLDLLDCSLFKQLLSWPVLW